MQIIDTFSGIGGFSLAGNWMGWRTIQFCEINNFCQKVLSYYWPGVPIHPDIKTLTTNQIINNKLYDSGETTIFCGGVPCQPWSVAGKRKGTEDNRNLWPETIKLIGEIQPDYAVLENVPGLVNWSKGVVFEQVQADLEAEGYEVIPFLLPACGVNAPHRRERIWFVAFNSKFKPNGRHHTGTGEGIGMEVEGNELDKTRWDKGADDVKSSSGITPHPYSDGLTGDNKPTQGHECNGRRSSQCELNSYVSSGDTPHSQSQGLEGRNGTQESVRLKSGDTKDDVTHPDDERLQGREGEGDEKNREWEGSEKEQYCGRSFRGMWNYWQNFPTQPPVRRGDDGLSSRLVGITVSKHRNESIKAYGNSVVPQVVFEIFKAINEFSSQQKPKNHEHLRKDLRAELMGRGRE